MRLSALLLASAAMTFAQPATPDTAAQAKIEVVKEVGGLDLRKMEKDGAKYLLNGSTAMYVVSRTDAVSAVAGKLGVSLGDARRLIDLAKSTPGQAILAGAAVGAGVLTVINAYEVEGRNGFFVRNRFWLAGGAALLAGLVVAAWRRRKAA